MSENAYVCPYCQSENIQSYNIAYAGGFSNVNGVTTGVGIGAYALLIYKTYQRYVWNRDIYPGLRRDWEHTYICLRCGNSFLL